MLIARGIEGLRLGIITRPILRYRSLQLIVLDVFSTALVVDSGLMIMNNVVQIATVINQQFNLKFVSRSHHDQNVQTLESASCCKTHFFAERR